MLTLSVCIVLKEPLVCDYMTLITGAAEANFDWLGKL